MMKPSKKHIACFATVLSLLHNGESFSPTDAILRSIQLRPFSVESYQRHKRKQGQSRRAELQQRRQQQQRHHHQKSQRMMISNDNEDQSKEFVDPSVSSSSQSSSDPPCPFQYVPRNLGDITREFIRNLAQLSLEDYKWRSGVFKAMTADRLLENSLARMRGDPSPGYYRPMDAPFVGPLGRAEDFAVSWLLGVIEEEGRRAQLIYDQNGVLVRPMEVDGGRGPLAEIESCVVKFFNTIRESERVRQSLGVLRPKDMDESLRGPLGNAEHRLYKALKDLSNSETLRLQQSLQRGKSVRPMDVPGPLGEVEAAVFEIFKAEQRRAFEKSQSKSLRPLRPKDASFRGPLGDAEEEAMLAFQRLSEEERERLRGILKSLENNRPMDISRNSFFGTMEAIIVGILRAPIMIANVWDRVTALLQSEPLSSFENSITSHPPPPVMTTTLKLPDNTEDELGAFE